TRNPCHNPHTSTSCPGIPLKRRSQRVLLCTGDPNREGSGSHRGQEIYIPLMLTPGLGPPCGVLRMVTALADYDNAGKTSNNLQSKQSAETLLVASHYFPMQRTGRSCQRTARFP